MEGEETQEKMRGTRLDRRQSQTPIVAIAMVVASKTLPMRKSTQIQLHVATGYGQQGPVVATIRDDSRTKEKE